MENLQLSCDCPTILTLMYEIKTSDEKHNFCKAWWCLIAIKLPFIKGGQKHYGNTTPGPFHSKLVKVKTLE